MAVPDDFLGGLDDFGTAVTTGGLGLLIPGVASGLGDLWDDVTGFVEDGASTVLDNIPVIGPAITGDNPSGSTLGSSLPSETEVLFGALLLIVMLVLVAYIAREVVG
jgi:hypothetical protein